MFKAIFAMLGGLIAFSAQAENPIPQALGQSTQKTAKPQLQRVPAPMMSVTRVTRQPDGTFSADCVQRPNPKARPKSGGAQP
jgi:hypothetical protein